MARYVVWQHRGKEQVERAAVIDLGQGRAVAGSAISLHYMES